MQKSIIERFKMTIEDGKDVFYIPVIQECFKKKISEFPILATLPQINENDSLFIKTNSAETAEKLWVACGNPRFE